MKNPEWQAKPPAFFDPVKPRGIAMVFTPTGDTIE
jgi:hypothetical protein